MLDTFALLLKAESSISCAVRRETAVLPQPPAAPSFIQPHDQSKAHELVVGRDMHCDMDAIIDRPTNWLADCIHFRRPLTPATVQMLMCEAHNHTRRGRSRHSQRKLLSSSQTPHRPAWTASVQTTENIDVAMERSTPERHVMAPLAGSRICSRAIRGSCIRSSSQNGDCHGPALTSASSLPVALLPSSWLDLRLSSADLRLGSLPLHTIRTPSSSSGP